MFLATIAADVCGAPPTQLLLVAHHPNTLADSLYGLPARRALRCCGVSPRRAAALRSRIPATQRTRRLHDSTVGYFCMTPACYH